MPTIQDNLKELKTEKPEVYRALIAFYDLPTEEISNFIVNITASFLIQKFEPKYIKEAVEVLIRSIEKKLQVTSDYIKVTCSNCQDSILLVPEADKDLIHVCPNCLKN